MPASVLCMKSAPRAPFISIGANSVTSTTDSSFAISGISAA